MNKFFSVLITIAVLKLSLANLVAQELQFYSQYKQDQYVYEKFFKNKREGVFVDIGAHDGVTLSNTCFFEKSLGWTGICVEPIPDVYNRLKANRKLSLHPRLHF